MDLNAWVTKAFTELPSFPETGLSVADLSRYCSGMMGRDTGSRMLLRQPQECCCDCEHARLHSC
jgi:hypothetical protein